MLLGYVDESYNKGFYYMVALLCPELTLQTLATRLDAVVAKAASTYEGIASTAELHGYELFHGKADWAALQRIPEPG